MGAIDFSNNIAYDISAIIILIYGLLYIVNNRRRNRNTFRWTMSLCGLTLIYCAYDMILFFAEDGLIVLNNATVIFISYVFFYSINLFTMFMFFFSQGIVGQWNRTRWVPGIPGIIIFVLTFIVNPFTDYLFSIDGYRIVMNPGMAVVDIMSSIYLFFFIATIIVRAKVLGRDNTVLMLIFGIGLGLDYAFFRPWYNTNVFTLLVALLLSFFIVFYYYADNSYDAMTGVLSADGFYRRSESYIHRRGRDKKFVIIRYDIRHLKEFNNRHGLRVGDLIIKKAAKEIQNIFPQTDCVGRISNDDFVVCITKEDFEKENLVTSFEFKVPKTGEMETVELLAGLYNVKDNVMPIPLMCDRASIALNALHASLTSHFYTFTEKMEEKLLEDSEMEHEMFEALESGQFQVYLQPVVDLKTELIVSAEALIRWIHPKKGMIPPYKFIELFERNGFINNLEEEVMRQVCDCISSLIKKGNTPIPISINISPYELSDTDHLMRMNAMIIERKLNGLVNTEITESAFIQRDEYVDTFIKNVKLVDAKILMDDFGSGYSSLNSLRNLPMDIVKLDMRFLDNDNEEEKGRIILEHIVRMVQALEKMIVVEGVETKDQVDFLRALGCDRVQGYYYYKPMPRIEFEKVLEEN